MPAGGGETETNRAGLSPALSGLRVQRDQAHVQPLDGALRLLDQRLARVLRRPVAVDRRSDQGAGPGDHPGASVRGTADRRRAGRPESGRQRQEQRLPGRAEVSDRRQRIVRGSVGPELRRQPRHAPGLRRAVLPEQRGDRRSARPQDRAAREPGRRSSACRRSPRSTAASRSGSTSARPTSRSTSTCSTCSTPGPCSASSTTRA